tara:strand:+ start:59 stop:283 length:225 start_codon:yes stop_codon:yes gene_type:complete
MILDKLNKWTMDILKTSKHKAELVKQKPVWNFTCFKCKGEWMMSDKDGVQPIFERTYITCPHCSKKARAEKMNE